MEGVSVLLTGFAGDEKKELEELVKHMGGILKQQAVPDVDFVVAKDVLSAKYKWARSIKKPVVTALWLRQCVMEHRQVPHDPFRMPALAGLRICATGISAEERLRIQEAAQKNGASYFADLTIYCTHLIALLPEGTKYAAAVNWKLKLVSQTWFWESIKEKVCLDEDYFPVRAPAPVKSERNLIAGVGSFKQEVIPLPEQAQSSIPLSGHGARGTLQRVEASTDVALARAQNAGNNDAMYLSGCRIFLLGFDASEMRRLVNLVRDGGGTRHMEMNETITHVILGSPPERYRPKFNVMVCARKVSTDVFTSESKASVLQTRRFRNSERRELLSFSREMRDIRQLAMWGAVYIVQPTWLEECSRQNREVETDQHQVPHNLLLQGKERLGWAGQERPKPDPGMSSIPDLQHTPLTESALNSSSSKVQSTLKVLPNNRLEATNLSGKGASLLNHLESHDSFHCGSDKGTMPSNIKGAGMASTSRDADRPSQDASSEELGTLKSEGPNRLAINVFEGLIFGFTDNYPVDQRADIVWMIREHGGICQDSPLKVDYILAPHGLFAEGASDSTVKYVSRNWLSYSVEEGKLLDTQSHVLFRPLPCQIPLDGFQGLKFCVSQYNDRDRKLLRRLCHVLKVKFTEKFNSKATHLICKVQAGEKYESACKLGVPCLTADWLYACIAQNKVMPVEDFPPRELTAAELEEAGKTFMTQFPRQCGHNRSLPADAQTQKPSADHLIPSQSMSFESKGATTTTRCKAPVGRRKPSGGLRSSQLNAQGANCTLSSQGDGNTLDPWDANAPLGAEVGESKMNVKHTQGATTQTRSAIPRPSPRPLTRSMKSGISPHKARSPEKPQRFSPRLTQKSISKDQVTGQDLIQKSSTKSLKQQDVASEIASIPARQEQEDAGEITREASAVFHNDAAVAATSGHQKESQEVGPNVVDAIEGLLRQTSKVMGGGLLEVTENQLISPEPTTLRRSREDTHTHPEFKKPKLYQTRSNKVEEDARSPSPTPNHENFLKFDESQIDSQMVAYDEDHSERQRIMERVRTRSSTMSLSGSSGVMPKTDKSAASWKGDQKLGRLFQAAEANK